MVTPEPPDDCPCGRGGEHLPEDPMLYNHQYVTHRVRLSGEVWAVEADLPRVQSVAEKMAAKAIEDRAKARMEESSERWKAMLNVTQGPLHDLIEMHGPILTGYNEILCEQCDHVEDTDNTPWLCRHWDLLTQLAP
jgi:hypothetical protein